MKILLAIILVFFILLKCFGQNEEKLPEVPWANLVEMHSKPETENGQWGVDVKVKLAGAYNQKDSIIIAETVQQLNKLTETISIEFSETERGNLEVFFIDSVNTDFPGYFLSYNKKPGKDKEPHTNKYFISDEGRTYSRIFIKKNRMNPVHYKQVLINTIAKEIGGGYLTDGSFITPQGNTRIIKSLKIAKNRNSIFNRYENVEAHRQKLNDLDIAIIKETYKPDYKKNMEIAREQFQFNPWWLKINPSVIIILPIGVLLLVCTYLAMFVYNIYSRKISKIFWKLNFKILLGIIVFTILVGTFTFFTDYWYSLAQGEIISSLKAFRVIQTFVIFFIAQSMYLFPIINLIVYLEKIIQKYIINRLGRLLLIFITTFLIPLLFIVVLNINSLKNHSQFSENDAIKNISTGFVIYLIMAGFWVIISYFISKEKDLARENEAKLSTLRELKTKAELNALHSRINPHFLYNSLNSIAGLAHENADQTEHMAISLSKLFRYSINKEKSDWTTLKEELEMVRIYLDVEKMRFEDSLTFSVEIPKDLEAHKIPRFIIQPLVENAVKHGISKSVEGGDIKINIYKKEKSIVIAVSDSGKPFANDLTPGFGIQSIYDKLEILYKSDFEINFTNSPRKQVTIKLN